MVITCGALTDSKPLVKSLQAASRDITRVKALNHDYATKIISLREEIKRSERGDQKA